jgi:hypothetical protein
VTVAVDASPTEAWAAGKLAATLSLPLVQLKHPEQIASEQIAVGYGAALALGIPSSSLFALDDESFLVSPAGNGSAVIASSKLSLRGSLYGVFEFMRLLGVRFLTANTTLIPSGPLSLPQDFQPTTIQPLLAYRDLITGPVSDHSMHDRSAEANLSTALELNGGGSHHGPVGGSNAWVRWGVDGQPGASAGFVATAYDLLSPRLLANTADCGVHAKNTPCLPVWQAHPEWFVCKPLHCSDPPCPPKYPCTLEEINVTYNSQPCWSNASMQQYMVSSILKILEKNPNASAISVSNMDGDNVECPIDRPANIAENTTGGANFRAVQAIADRVNKDFPHVKVVALAYNGALEPPAKLKFAPNVIVQLCLQGMKQFLPLTEPQNQPTVDRVRKWKSVASTLYVWDYTVSFHSVLLPWANYWTQARRIQELHALGVTGYFGEGWPHAGLDMADMKTYVVSRTAFDPSLNPDGLIETFTDGFYSAHAAVHVREYLSIMSRSFNSSNFSLDYAGRPLEGHALKDIDHTNSCYGNQTLLDAASALIAAKKSAAPGETYQLRLSQALLNVQWVVLLRWAELQDYAAASHQPWPLAPTLAAEFDAFANALTYAFRESKDQPHFQEDFGHGKKDCDLGCFAAQLGLNGSRAGGGYW